MKSLWKICFVFGLLWSSIAAAEIFEATVNRTEIPQGETFLLTLKTDDDKTNATPDLSVLDKDFEIVDCYNLTNEKNIDIDEIKEKYGTILNTRKI